MSTISRGEGRARKCRPRAQPPPPSRPPQALAPRWPCSVFAPSPWLSAPAAQLRSLQRERAFARLPDWTAPSLFSPPCLTQSMGNQLSLTPEQLQQISLASDCKCHPSPTSSYSPPPASCSRMKLAKNCTLQLISPCDTWTVCANTAIQRARRSLPQCVTLLLLVCLAAVLLALLFWASPRSATFDRQHIRSTQTRHIHHSTARGAQHVHGKRGARTCTHTMIHDDTR